MKIGIYDPYLDDCGGGEKYMMNIAQSLSKNHKVSIFWDHKKDLDKVSDRFSLNLSNVSLEPNIFSPKTSRIKRYLASKRYDIIIVLSDGSIPLVSSKLFLHIQRPIQRPHLTIFDKQKMKRIESIFCNSNYTKSFIDKIFKVDAQVLYPPVNLDPIKTKKDNIILHVGRFRVVDKTVGISDYKKQNFMISAFKEMVDHGFKGWKLVMLVSVKPEDEVEFAEMRKTAKGYPIEFEINKSNKDLWFYYSKAKIYWHASGYGEDLDKMPEAAEHFGISTVEAMGAGVVPVVINAGGQKEIVEDGVNGLLWNTLPELIEVTLILAGSKEMISELSKNAQKRAADFGIKLFNERLEMILSL